ncbi:hypothetical protein TRFO_28082 [Tritrichomonas foetus]|uniref:Uncharacterized protein n=1 Tax=Tritrichomonas foetus TaxID=1144522 RepID=A0A1J4JYY6_9EUKA|nr:hypothetical protein TRFO_28082 [Tritrichomonas foetus]|eukprot:OHT04383.1 hypothetical protein TRFO_28082 [Tritrichomonas foetus]
MFLIKIKPNNDRKTSPDFEYQFGRLIIMEAKNRFNQTSGNLDPRPGGSQTQSPIVMPKTSPAVETALAIFRTIFFTALFLIVCKLTHFRQKMLYDVRINRKFLGMFYLFSAIVIIFYVYLLTKLRILRPPNKRIDVDDWDRVAPIPMYTCTGCLVCAVICFIFALFPCFRFMTFVIGALGFITMTFILQWVPF